MAAVAGRMSGVKDTRVRKMFRRKRLVIAVIEAAALVVGGAALASTGEELPALLYLEEREGGAAERRSLPLERWRTEREFSVAPRDPFAAGDPISVRQSAVCRDEGVTVRAEMGDLAIEEGRATVSGLSRRGARLSLARSGNGGATEVKSFAFTGANRGDDRGYLLGVAGKLTLLERVQLKTLYVSARETRAAAGPVRDGASKGDVVGISASFDPYQGRLALEGEVDYALFDDDTTDAAPPVGDVACRAALGGESEGYRYRATFERTGPRYRIISGTRPRPDWLGYGVGAGRDFGSHAVEVKLSRYNDNVEGTPLVPTRYRYEGTLDYSCRVRKDLPLGLLYRKEIEERDNPGGSRRGSDRDTVAGRVNYLAGDWDLGVRASLSQRLDLSRDARDQRSAALALAPTYGGRAFTVAPDLTVRRSYYLLAGQRSDEYGAGVDIRGNLPVNGLDYQLKGGFRTVLTDPAATRSDSLHAGVRLGYPLKRLFRALSGSTVGVRGEYSGVKAPARRESAYSLQVVLEGR